MKNNLCLVSVALVSTVAGCGDTDWLRDLGPADASASGNGVVCALEGAEVATVGCAATVDQNNPCADGTTGRYCSGGAIVGACHVLAGRSCHPGTTLPPPVDAGTTPPPPPPPVDGGVLGPIVCSGREAVIASCNGQGCQDGVMGLNCSADGRSFEGSCHLIAGRQCWPTPVDAGTVPVDTGVVTPPPAGMAGPGQIRVAINPEFYRWRRSSSDPNVIDRDASGNPIPFCSPGLLNVDIYNQLSMWVGTYSPITTDRTVMGNFSAKGGGERFDVRCGETGTAYPYPEAWRVAGLSLRQVGVTIASVGVAGLENQLDTARVCRAEGGNKGELAVQAMFVGRCVNP